MKYLLSRKGEKGLFFFTDTEDAYKFVVATIDTPAKVGEAVPHWHSGTYFASLEEAWRAFNNVR